MKCDYCGAQHPESKYERLGRRIDRIRKSTSLDSLDAAVAQMKRSQSMNDLELALSALLAAITPVMEAIGDELQ